MNPFLTQFNGPLTGLLRWPDWEALTRRLADGSDGGWYVYYVGEGLPEAPLPAAHFARFMEELDRLLRADHQEEYLGIIYVDDREQPTFVKVYDPNNLGAACGSSGRRVLPGWTLSRVPPVDLNAEYPNPGGRRRWWQRWLNAAAVPV